MRLSFRPPHPSRDRADAVEILPPLAVAGPAAGEPERDADRAGRDAVDRVEAELVRAARAVGVAARDGCAETAAAASDAAALARNLDALAAEAGTAGARGLALGAAADTLAEEADGLAGVLVQAARHLERTDAQSRVLETEMVEAAQDSARLVEAVATLARQANRLALGATVEAVRAGTGGETLWQMAEEFKLLSADAARAVEAVRALNRRLSGPGAVAAGGVATSRAGLRPALLMLAFMVLYKLGDSMATALATPFYLDMGFTKTEIGLIAKHAGLWPSVIGGLIGGIWMIKLGINRALWLFGVVQLVSILGFALLTQFPQDRVVLAIAISFEALGVGLGTVAFVAYIARATHPLYTATQFALFTSLAAAPRVVINSVTGVLVEQTGWLNFFFICTLLAVPGMLLLPKVAPWNGDQPAPRSAANLP